MNALIRLFTRPGLFSNDLDHHLVRATMVLTFLIFGYQKWFPSEADRYGSAGGFPTMTPIGAFLVKDLVMFAASFYLLRQDVLRVARTETHRPPRDTALHQPRGRRRARATAGHDSRTAA